MGSGPFPTELHDETGELLRQKGHEFGATTGRARRTGWLDLPALRYTLMINGVTDLVMMKSDVMDGFESICVAESYRLDGKPVEGYPDTESAERVEPVYASMPGWKTPISSARSYDSLPQEFKAYIEYIVRNTGLDIKMISVGPDREETIVNA